MRTVLAGLIVIGVTLVAPPASAAVTYPDTWGCHMVDPTAMACDSIPMTSFSGAGRGDARSQATGQVGYQLERRSSVRATLWHPACYYVSRTKHRPGLYRYMFTCKAWTSQPTAFPPA